ncbi:MAG TPA: NAD-dependent epimerase/dehydratase family protein [Candidatus Saccharimonadales bacterium]|jgi:GDP-4-dehydro-6-deoxy-D-mannose reductase|nr:NAD-dependent epimerase/dehydratase family protein [Candidatus Saccharimonadales bacterium]
MVKVLVTGAGGFVGQHLVRELLDHDYEIVVVDRTAAKGEVSSGAVRYLELDLTKPEQAAQIDFAGVGGVVHLAGLAAVGPSFDNPKLYMDVNVGIEINLFETALKQGAKPRFLIISSGTLYDPKAPQPLTEESPVLPNSPYAVSKIGQEQMAMYYATRGFEAIIARPFNHIGPGQGPGFIVPDFAQQLVAIQKGEQSEMLVGNLDAQRDYTDVRDIVRAYRLLLEKGHSGEIYNICSGKPISGHEILEGLSQAAGLLPEVKQDPTKMRPSDTPTVSGNHDKLTQDTDWQPEISLETTFTDVIADWRSR